MTADHPVTDLMNDHRLIEAVMSALERKLSADGDFPSDFVGRALAFFVEYADRFHHGKEEEALFPALAERGVAVESGPIGMMLYEHTLGRKLLAGIRDNLEAARNGDAAARAAVRANALQYVELLRGHIWKEDNVLFAMARRVLDEGGSRQLLVQFEESGAVLPRESVEKHRLFAAQLRE